MSDTGRKPRFEDHGGFQEMVCHVTRQTDFRGFESLVANLPELAEALPRNFLEGLDSLQQKYKVWLRNTKSRGVRNSSTLLQPFPTHNPGRSRVLCRPPSLGLDPPGPGGGVGRSSEIISNRGDIPLTYQIQSSQHITNLVQKATPWLLNIVDD